MATNEVLHLSLRDAITQAQDYTITSASSTSAQQGQVSTVPGLTIPVLTVDEAVALAVKGNRHVRSTALGVDAAQQETAALRTARWPQFQTYLLRETLRPISFTIPEGGTGSNSEERSSENA